MTWFLRWPLLLAVAGLSLSPSHAVALILGGAGAEPVRDPGWPAGADKVFNSPHRVAWWEGPPYGGGQWHAECRGGTAEFNQVLKDFAAIDAPPKRVFVHDGVGNSFWLNPNGVPEKAEAARIDWIFVVWASAGVEQQRRLPAEYRPPDLEEESSPRIDVYVGGGIDWSKVTVPDGVDVIDHRLASHGFSEEDGTVLEGTVQDLAGAPLQAAVELQAPESESGAAGQYAVLQHVKTDADGHWVIRKAPSGPCRLVAFAEGRVPRVIEYYAFNGRPRWIPVETKLAPGGSITGRTVDDKGSPLPGVDVRLAAAVSPGGVRYRMAADLVVRTDADGRFVIADAPMGSASLRLTKPGYVRPGLGPTVEVPSDGLQFVLNAAASITISVDFADVPRPEQYLVEMNPAEGSKVGSWGGSGMVDATGKVEWKGIPAGRYVVYGRPNPGSESDKTEPVTVELHGGEHTAIVLKPRK